MASTYNIAHRQHNVAYGYEDLMGEQVIAIGNDKIKMQKQYQDIIKYKNYNPRLIFICQLQGTF